MSEPRVRRRGAAIGPLRKIVGVERDRKHREILRERLECGHLVSIKQDFFGETTADRRRCRACR